MYRTTTRLFQAAVLMAAVLLAATGARADVDGAYADGSTWYFDITHVPDFDQKRTVLPGEGVSHCVPTSGINWMAYFANHGRPTLNPGPGDWQSQARYDDASDAIFALGALMGTDAEDGTNASGAWFGLWIWSMGGPMVVNQSLSNGTWSPKFDDAATAVFLGGYVNLGIGWYIMGAHPLIVRDGGHAVTLTNGARSGYDRILAIHDPAADEGDRTIQSPFNAEPYAVERQHVMPANYAIQYRYMDKLVGYGTGYLDAYLSIRPLFALTSPPGTPIIFTKQAFVLDGSIAPEVMSHGPLACSQIIDLTLLMDNNGYACVVDPDAAQPNQLWIINALTGEDELVDASLNDPQRVVVGRYRDYFVMDGNELVKINPDVDPVETTRVMVDGEIGAMCYDDAADEVVLLATDTRRVLRYGHTLGSPPEEQIIPVPLTGRTSLCVNGALECLMLVSDDADALWQLTKWAGIPELSAVEHVLPEIVEPKSVQAGDDGRVYLSCVEQVVELEYSTTRGTWTPVADSYFGEMTVGDCLVVARSRSNDDPEIHDTPAWRNVLPWWCREDLVDPAGVEQQDLNAVLNRWGDPECEDGGAQFPCPEDLATPAGVEQQDLNAVLNRWGDPECEPAGVRGDLGSPPNRTRRPGAARRR